MLIAKHHRLTQLFFGWYFRRLFNRQFAGFKGELPVLPTDKAICWISNHSSWWDGIWPLLLNDKYPKRPFYVLMLEKELVKRKFLRGLGAFSIAPGQRSMAESGRYLEKLLHTQQNLVLLYPQGQLESLYQDNIHFAPGMLRYACQANAQINWLFSAFFVDYGAFTKPAVYHYHQLFTFENQPTPQEINNIYQHFYAEKRQQQVQMLHMQHNLQTQ